MYLDYYPFIFIIDAITLLGIIDHKLGNYIHQVNGGQRSRMKFSEDGLLRFQDIESPYKFKELIDHDLVVMTDIIPCEIKKGKNKGKIKNSVKVIPYTDTDSSKNDKKLIKKLIDIYNKSELNVNADKITLNSSEFIYDLLLYYTNSRINNVTFAGKLVNVNDHITNIININNNIDIYNKDKINISQNNSNIKIDKVLRLLMDINAVNRKYSQLNNEETFNDKGESNPNENPQRLEINKVAFTIKDKSLFRVYSRGKWSKHGRFYTWQQNLPKKLRSYFYLNGSNQPLTSLDFSGMHLILSYHLKGLKYNDDPYTLEQYGEEKRKWFKYIGLIAINAKNRHEAIYATMKKLKEKKLADLKYNEVKKLLKDFEKKHHKISDVFYQDRGVDCMAFDSAVLCECFKELMVRQNITILGVHDEIMCEPAHRDTVRAYMIEAYRKVLKRELIKKKILNRGDELSPELMPIL